MIDLKLDKKIVLITGGSRGIGKAIAKLFVDEGANVIITSKNQKKLQQTSKELGNLFFVAGDIKNEKDVKNVIDKTIMKFGRIDILVNNAGSLPKMKQLDSKSPPSRPCHRYIDSVARNKSCAKNERIRFKITSLQTVPQVH